MRPVYVLCFLLACVGDEAASPAQPDGPAATQAVERGPLASRLRGVWDLKLTPSQDAQLRVMKLGLQEPPPDAGALDAAGLSDDERMVVEMTIAMVQRAPDDPRLAEMRAMVESLDSAFLTVTDDHISLSLGAVVQDGPYALLGEDLQVVRVRMRNGAGVEEEHAFTFIDDVTVQLVGGSPDDSMTFLRRRAAPVPSGAVTGG